MELNRTYIELLVDSLFRTADSALSSRLTSTECRNKFMSFLCGHIIIKPCNLNDTDAAMKIQPLASECKEIRDDVCFAEWKLLELSPYAEYLPNCSSLDGGDDEVDSRRNLTCNKQFERFCDSLCLPLCKEFSQNSDGLTLLQDILFIFAAVSSLIGGTIVIIIAIYRRKSM